MSTVLQGGEDLARVSRKRGGSVASLEEEVIGEVKMARAAVEYKVVFRLKDQSGDGFRAMNPLKIAEGLKCLGEKVKAHAVPSGALLVFCLSEEQVARARKISKLCGKKVEVLVPEQGDVVKGVIYSVCGDMTEQEIKDNVSGGEVVEVRRFRAREGGSSNTPVLLTFRGNLPARVYLGCVSYQVREYIRPPMRCFKCQRFGHMAPACRGGRRCLKCGGDHDIAKCEIDSVKCCNCGGSHMASSRECDHFTKARKVQVVKEQHKITYAEALQRMEGVAPVMSGARVAGIGGSAVSELADVRSNGLVVHTESLLAFIVNVLCSMGGKSSRSDLIKSVAVAANRFLGLPDLTPQSLSGYIRVQERKFQRGSDLEDPERPVYEDISD